MHSAGGVPIKLAHEEGKNPKMGLTTGRISLLGVCECLVASHLAYSASNPQGFIAAVARGCKAAGRHHAHTYDPEFRLKEIPSAAVGTYGRTQAHI